MRRFLTTKAAETSRRRWGRSRECSGRWGRGQHDVQAKLSEQQDQAARTLCLRICASAIHSPIRLSHSLSQKNTSQAWLFVDSVFPVKLVAWDPRYYTESFVRVLLDSIKNLISTVHTHGFNPISVEPHVKDGGCLCSFRIHPSQSEDVLCTIQSDLRNHIHSKGGVPSSAGIRRGNIWVVQGQPWREDMNRFASPLLRESLYHTFRPYGRIIDITPPAAVTGTSYRSSTVNLLGPSLVYYRSPCCSRPLHRSNADSYFLCSYVQAHVIRDWISKHPRIVIPVIVFFLGTLTYTIFDPVRALMVEGKMLDWFDYREFRLYQWLRRNTVDKLTRRSTYSTDVDAGAAWQERRDAEIALCNYLDDTPASVAFVHGPQGSGKSRMLSRILQDKNRPVLVIDCAELQRADSDIASPRHVSKQTGYWPVFTFLKSMNHLIDLASVGLIGQNAGLSTSLPDQVRQVLEVVGTALHSISSRRGTGCRASPRTHPPRHLARPTHGGVAGGGVIAELGVGDEPFNERDEDFKPGRRNEEYDLSGLKAVNTLPIVVLKNYTANGKEEVMGVFARWAAALVEEHHSPSRPLNMIALSDVDNASALQFVRTKLQETGTEIQLSHDDTKMVEWLGGRASDLASLIHKIRAGQTPTDAVEDIIRQGVSELRNGEETPLRSMERAEMISVDTQNGRPSAIRPGRPIYRHVFQRLVDDPIFQASQDLASNTRLIDSAEATVRACEQELQVLRTLGLTRDAGGVVRPRWGYGRIPDG
ncbi:RNA12 protein-domain-containing protein [Lactarius pseudohatsudake]|nr:RNA12 protein-domain-containing protein [Lactarius pseudohatsudake]